MSPERRTGPGRTGPGQTGSDRTGPDPTRPGHTGPDRVRLDQTGPDPTGPDPAWSSSQQNPSRTPAGRSRQLHAAHSLRPSPVRLTLAVSCSTFSPETRVTRANDGRRRLTCKLHLLLDRSHASRFQKHFVFGSEAAET